MTNAAGTLTWFDGRWHHGNYPILGAADHGAWLGSLVFDGARAFEGVTPDLDRHCARTNASARAMGLSPPLSDGELTELALEGVAQFPRAAELYIRPMIWARDGLALMVPPDPETTAVAICIEERPMPPGPTGITLTTTRFRRPTIECMPTDLKGACLYPNNARMIREARSRGFDNALVEDMLGNVAETATANIFMVRDGAVFTPVPTGCFLAGITRDRVIRLLRADGMTVVERTLTLEDFEAADEIFSTGNAMKVMPVTRLCDRDLPHGPVARRARELYWDFAHGPG